LEELIEKLHNKLEKSDMKSQYAIGIFDVIHALYVDKNRSIVEASGFDCLMEIYDKLKADEEI